MGFEDILNSIIYGPAGAKKLKREGKRRENIGKASRDLLEMAKGAGGLQGMVQEPTAIQLPEQIVPPIGIQPQMGGLDVQGQIPGLTIPARTEMGSREVPLQESGDFQTKIAQLASAMGGESLMDLLTTQTAQPELTYQQKSDIDLAEAKGLATFKEGLKETTTKPTTTLKSVQDPESPTGWSWQNPAGEKMTGAPKPSSLVNITLPKPASASERTAIAEGEATIDTLNNLKTLFDIAGKNVVGPIKGRYATVKDVFGQNKELESEFIAATAAFKNQIIKSITGAAMGEAEATRIMKQVPDVNNPPSVWKARWKQSLRNIEIMQEKRIEVLRKSGIKAPEVGGPPPAPQTAEDYLQSLGIE